MTPTPAPSAPAGDLRPFLALIGEGRSLSADQAAAAFEVMMAGEATPAQMGAFLMGLKIRGETVAEITGAARAMRARALSIPAPADAIDTCGTGGDGVGTWNISTAAALVVAGCGVPVAKHGNRKASSRSGAADVLEALGVNLDADVTVVARCLAEAGTCFLLAPRFHAATRHVVPVRVEMGVRTIFNILGPLSNPAGTRRQVMGVYDPRWLQPLAEVLRDLGSERVWLVHGSDGLDEITVTGPTEVVSLELDGTIRRFQVTPEDAGLSRWPLEALRGGTPAENAAALRAVLAGEPGAYREIVLLNAAAALLVAGRAETLADGVRLAAAAIEAGRPAEVLQALVAITRGER